ncbi:MAG: site-specific integrase [Candidatus Riflebacteria bacterium]|nr:site-specific integrase [Candidatus Riflebacteria bacterium]
MQYIMEVGTKLYFRRRIPPELQSILGMSEFKRSLNTKRMEDAKGIAAHLNQMLEKIFVSVASGIALDVIMPGIGLKLRKRLKVSAAPQMLSAMYKRFADEMLSTRQWNDKTSNENRITFNLFLNLKGDMPIQAVTHAMLMEYRSMVQRLPPNSTKAKATRDTNLLELVKMNHTQTLSITRVNHILMPLTGLFGWLQRHEYIKDNPAHNLLLPKGRHGVRPDEERKRYSNAEIRTIIEELRHYREIQPERFWIPIICAYSAMRVSECSQMAVDNVKCVDGVWVFELSEGKDRSLKSRSAIRIIPIHPFILSQGFLAYADGLRVRGAERLFPNLRKHRRNGYGHQIIQWWSRFKSRISNDKKLSFHSLRHSACDELKQKKVDPAVIAEIMGHSLGSISMERYGKRFSAQILMEAITQISY